MEVIRINDQHFKGTLPSQLGSWLEQEFGTTGGRTYLICENAHNQSEDNDQIIAAGLASVAHSGPLSPDEDMVVIDRSSEVGSFGQNRGSLIKSFCSDTGLPLTRIVYCSQNVKLADQMQALFRSTEAPQHLFFHHFAIGLAMRYHGKQLDNFKYDALKTRRVTFLCLNYKLRPHRATLIASILSSALRDHTILSDCQVDKIFDTAGLMSAVERDYPAYTAIVRSHMESKPTEHGRLGNELLYSWPRCEVESSFLSIITESDYRNNIYRVTEKSLKPIAYHRPFVILGPKGCLRILKKWGFETFDSIFDESYDEADTPQSRMQAILSLAHDLLAASPDLIMKCRSICERNQRYFTNGFLGALRDEFRTNMMECLSTAGKGR